MRFPLHTYPEDIVDLCGPGIYRVYALDALGEQLGDEHIARWDLTSSSSREQRNTSMDPMLALRADRPAMTTATPPTDMRFALETMAQMMRTNSDALRLVAESQVDLAKTIANAKGLPRNAAMSLPPPAAKDEDDADDDGEGEAAPKNIYDVLVPIAEQLAPAVGTLVTTFTSGATGRPSAPTATSTAPTASPTDDLASRPFEARELVDFGYAHRKGEAKRAAKQQTTPTISLHARVMQNPQLLRQIMAIKSALDPDEIETLMSAAATWPEEEQTQFLNSIKPVPVAVAVEFCREVIATIHAQQRANSEDKGAV